MPPRVSNSGVQKELSFKSGGPIPGVDGPDADDNQQERARVAQVAAAKFDALKQDVRALSIPMLTQAQFLAFIGYSVGKPLPLDL